MIMFYSSLVFLFISCFGIHLQGLAPFKNSNLIKKTLYSTTDNSHSTDHSTTLSQLKRPILKAFYQSYVLKQPWQKTFGQVSQVKGSNTPTSLEQLHNKLKQDLTGEYLKHEDDYLWWLYPRLSPGHPLVSKRTALTTGLPYPQGEVGD